MTTEASQLMAEVLKCVKMNGDFMPADIGKRIGLSREQSDQAARSLSNAGVLVIGFDNSAHYSEDYRKMAEKNLPKTPVKATRKKKVAVAQPA